MSKWLSLPLFHWGILLQLVTPWCRGACDLHLTLTPLRNALQEAKFDDSAEKAQKAGVDLQSWLSSPSIGSFQKNSLFYLFFNSVSFTGGANQYLIQTSKRVVKLYASDFDQNPLVETDYMVEVFKTQGNRIKGNDRHHGYFPLGKKIRKEIHKELEIGCGEIPGVLSGVTWPLDASKKYVQIQPYINRPELYSKVVFQGSKKWTIDAVVDRTGRFSVRAPELSINMAP